MLVLLTLVLAAIMWIRPRLIIPLFIAVSLWINQDLRAGPLTMLMSLSVIVICIYFFNPRYFRFSTSNDLVVFNYFKFFIIAHIPFIFLSSQFSITANLNSVKSSLLNIPFLVVLWKCNVKDANLKAYFNIINVAILLMLLYGVFCYVSNANPYMSFMSAYSASDNYDDKILMTMEDARGMLKGRIMCTATYPIQYAILIAITFFLYLKLLPYQRSKYINYMFILLLGVNIYLTGSRGPIVGLALGLILCYSKLWPLKKLLLYIFFFSYVYLCMCVVVPDSLNGVLSLFQNENMGGSSTTLRLKQMASSMSMALDSWQSLLFGHGLGYASYYISKFGHWNVWGFEGILNSGIVNYGICGLIVFFVINSFFLFFIVKSFYAKKLISKRSYCVLLGLLMCRIVYLLLVGGSYDRFFLIVYFMIIKISLVETRGFQYDRC